MHGEVHNRSTGVDNPNHVLTSERTVLCQLKASGDRQEKEQFGHVLSGRARPKEPAEVINEDKPPVHLQKDHVAESEEEGRHPAPI